MKIVEAHNISFRYPHQATPSTPTSLGVAAGDCLLITGESGSGKSTLLRCLAGMIPHLYHGELTGEVWIDGLNSVTTPLWQLAERAGLVFQNPATQMLTFTVADEIIFGLENLGLSRTEISQRLEEVLTLFHLQDLRQRNPQSLSGGEQQRLALAAIVARRPRILLLDEPLSMLDTTAVQEFISYLAHIIAAGTTIIISEHRLQEVAHLPHVRYLHLDNKHLSRNDYHKTPPPLPILPANGSLHVRHLQVGYDQTPILANLNLDIAAGEIVAIVGRNGVGKTTLLRCLAGLQSYAGNVNVGEKPAEFGLVFQNADLQLFNPSVREEICYHLPHIDQELYSWLLDLFNLHRYEETPPLLLSEGEKKRVALATIIMQLPRDGLLLDEPSLGQDNDHKQRLVRLMQALAQAGKIVLFTTHDLALAAQANRLILLGKTGIIADGSPHALFQETACWEQVGLTLPAWFYINEEISPT